MNKAIFQEHVFPIRHKLYRFALRITGSAHDAEDIVQEVMEKVWKSSSEQTAQVNNWEAWCMTLTRNRSVDKTRSRNLRRFAPIDGLQERQADSVNLAHATEQRDMAGMVRRMMDELPEKQRLVMHLRDVEEMSYEEISETLNITLDQVKVNLHRARKSIRDQVLNLENAQTEYIR